VHPLLESRWVRRAAVAAALVGLYALLGFQLAPRVLRSQAIAYVHEHYGRELGIGEVRVNPFLLQLDVRDFSLPDVDGRPMLAFHRLFVDFEASSLWKRAWTFRIVRLEAPRVSAVVRPGGTFNLADLAPGSTSPKPEAGPPPAVWLQALEVADGAVTFTDRNRSQPFTRELAPVAFSLRNFHTTRDGGSFRLAAETPAGEGLSWQGRLSVAPAPASQGEISVHGLRLPGIVAYLGDALPFALGSGHLDLSAHYEVALRPALVARVTLPEIRVSDLALRARGENADWIRVPAITLEETSLEWPQRRVSVARLRVEKASVQAWMAHDGSVNLAKMFAPAAQATVSSQPAPEESPPAAAAAGEAAAPGVAPVANGQPPAWALKLGSTEIAAAHIDFEDRRGETAHRFVVEPLEVRLGEASLDLSKAVSVTASAVVNGVAPIKVEGTVAPAPLAVDLAVHLAGARMQILQPYVLPVADLTIKDGRLTVDGRARVAPPAAPGPKLKFEGEVAIDDFASIDNAFRQPLVAFKRLELRKLAYAMDPDSVHIDRVRIVQPFARVSISPERVINIAAVLDPKGTAAALAARRAAAAAEAAMTPAERRQREEAAERTAEARKSGAAPEPAEEPLPAEGMPVRIREVEIAHGTLDFADHWVQPNFAAKVQDVRGTLTGLSSDPASHATIDLKGQLGEFSPVTISGEVQPFSLERYADLKLHFANIQLPILNPYSGEFAGYAIAKGTLTTDLHYRITNRQLDAQHHVHIEQLEWGERTATQGEATLPVKFATVLLRDRHGVIDLDIPVKGTLGDPTFRVWPIVWHIIKNLVVKAVTAPFALLGSLFSGAEQAQYVDFAPGSAVLEPPSAQALGALAKSLAEKPGLSVDVPIGTLPALDGPGLRELAYRASLEQAIGTALPPPRKEGATRPGFDALTPRNQITVLTALVKQQTGKEPALPEPPKPAEGTSRDDAEALAQSAAIRYLESEARADVAVPDSALGQLGEDRAAAVQHALLEGSGLEPGRVFQVRDGKVSEHDGQVRLELGLK
jgi:hypothetical protein